MVTAAPAPPTTSLVDTEQTLVEHFRRQVRERGPRPALYFRAGGRWAPITWAQFGDAARRLSALLVAEGVEPQGHVAIWAANRPEWHIADMAVLGVRGRPTPVYLTLSAEQAAYVIGHSESSVAVVESPAILDRIRSVRDRLPALRRVVVMSGLEAADADGFAIPWTTALERGEAALAEHAPEVDRRAAQVAMDDVATLIYTSGTTGPPKAVKLTHRNVLSAARSILEVVPADADDRGLSYLPLAHIAERMNTEFRQYLFGNPTWFAESIDKLGEHLREVRPTLFFAVPRIWEKMATQIRAGVEGQSGVRGLVGRWALRTGAEVASRREQGRPVGGMLARRHALADRVVFARVREQVGLDQARVLVSGAAPIAPDVLRLLAAVGLEVDEVYGQTEGTGIATINRPGAPRIGTVGQPFPGIDVRIAEDGEILIRGDAVFAGYHKDEAATREALEDGWLHTGDVGEFDADGYLRITDRKKDLIITAGGKNISPSNIETKLKHHPLVANAVVIGDRRPFVSALLTLDPEHLAGFARQHGLEGDDSTLSAAEPVRAALQAHVDAVNADLSNVERVKRFTVLPRDFQVGDELTPTLKVKRKVVAEKYAAEIEANYSAPR